MRSKLNIPEDGKPYGEGLANWMYAQLGFLNYRYVFSINGVMFCFCFIIFLEFLFSLFRLWVLSVAGILTGLYHLLHWVISRFSSGWLQFISKEKFSTQNNVASIWLLLCSRTRNSHCCTLLVTSDNEMMKKMSWFLRKLSSIEWHACKLNWIWFSNWIELNSKNLVQIQSRKIKC
jgi:hypothetical protein